MPLLRSGGRSQWFVTLLGMTILSLFGTGCSGWMHGVTLAERVQRMLPASVGPGASSLAIESNYDQTLRSYVQDHGAPDYIYVVDRYNIHLIYLNTDTVATFTRGYTSNSTIGIRERIPDAILARLPERERSRVLLARGEVPTTRQRPKPPASQTVPEPLPVAKEPENPISVGTCFAVSPDGLIVTAYHIVAKASAIAIYLSDGTVVPAVVERASPTTDLALLRIKGPAPVYLSLAQAGSLTVGQRVFTVGYPVVQILGTDPKFSEGVINSLSGIGGDATFMQISVPIQPGNSGGPLVTESGEVAGVIVTAAKSSAFLEATGALPQNVNWAVRAEYISPLLGKRHEQPRASSRTVAIERTTKAVCMVIGKPGT